jgi:hypothetical protein
VLLKLDAALYKRMKDIHGWKANLLALHRPELVQSSQYRITPTPSTLAEVVHQGHKSKPTDANKQKEEGEKVQPTNKEKEAERRRKAAAAKAGNANKNDYTPEQKAAYALKKQEERNAKNKNKYGPGGNPYTPEEKAAYALKKKAEQAKKQKL